MIVQKQNACYFLAFTCCSANQLKFLKWRSPLLSVYFAFYKQYAHFHIYITVEEVSKRNILYDCLIHLLKFIEKCIITNFCYLLFYHEREKEREYDDFQQLLESADTKKLTNQFDCARLYKNHSTESWPHTKPQQKISLYRS